LLIGIYNIANISAETMTIHHTKHHNTYVTNLNAALEKLDGAVSAGDVSDIIAMQGAIKFNGGGHLNHTLFWENMCDPSSSELKDGALSDLITSSFGSYEAMKNSMAPAAVGVQGSGWAWLGYNKKSDRLEIATCPNQVRKDFILFYLMIAYIDIRNDQCLGSARGDYRIGPNCWY